MFNLDRDVAISIVILLALVVSVIDHTQNRSRHRDDDSAHVAVVAVLDPAPDLGFDFYPRVVCAFSRISRVLEGIPTEHIELICSLES